MALLQQMQQQQGQQRIGPTETPKPMQRLVSLQHTSCCLLLLLLLLQQQGEQQQQQQQQHGPFTLSSYNGRYTQTQQQHAVVRVAQLAAATAAAAAAAAAATATATAIAAAAAGTPGSHHRLCLLLTTGCCTVCAVRVPPAFQEQQLLQYPAGIPTCLCRSPRSERHREQP